MGIVHGASLAQNTRIQIARIRTSGGNRLAFYIEVLEAIQRTVEESLPKSGKVEKGMKAKHIKKDA